MRARMESCEIGVRLTPRARSDEVVGERDGIVLIRVHAPPVDGRANEALCRLLAKRLGIGVRSVSVVRGAGARDKLVRIEGVSAGEARKALQAGT